MRIRTSLVALALAVAASACSAGTSPPPTTSPNPSTGYGQDLQRAHEVADQVNQRESELEQMVDDMGG